jgi:hypothetical protein
LGDLKTAAGAWRLLIGEMDTGGWNHDMVRDFAVAADRVFFVFRGAIYARPPTQWSVADHYLSRCADWL